MTVGELVTAALARGTRAPRVWGLVWASEALLAFVAAAPAYALFHAALAPSTRGRLALERLDAALLIDLANGPMREGAPAIFGAAAGAVVVYLLISPLLAGVGLAAFAQVEGGARFFWRLLRLLAVALAGYALVVALVGLAAAGVLALEEGLLDERIAVALELLLGAFALFAFTFASAAADLARARLVIADAHSAFRAFGQALRATLSSSLCWGTLFCAGVAGALAAGLFYWIQSAIWVEGAWSAAFAFLFGQLALGARAWGRAVGWAGAVQVALALDPARRETGDTDSTASQATGSPTTERSVSPVSRRAAL